MIEAPVSRISSGESALTVALVPTGMNCGVSTTPWVSVSVPVRARVVPFAGRRRRDLEPGGPAEGRRRHASGAGSGSSHSPGIPGSVRRGGGIS